MKKGDTYVLDPSRDFKHKLLDKLKAEKTILYYDEAYDPPNDSRSYFYYEKDGQRYSLVLEDYEVVKVGVAANTAAAAGPGGMKYDGGKPRMALVFDGMPRALEAVGQVLTFGAQKYAAHSWQTVPEGEERYKSALLRHLTAVGRGEELDSESGLHHLAHAACNALFILELELRKRDESLSKSN